MAGENEIKKAEIGLGVTDETFESYNRLISMLGTVFDQLTKIQGSAKQVNLGNVSFNDPDKAGFTQQLAGLQKDLRTLLSAVRQGSPNAQFNSAILSNQKANLQFADNRVDLTLTQQANASAERRVMLQNQQNVAMESTRVHAVEQIGLTREIQQVTEKAAAAQERLRNAIVATDTAAAANATREIRDGRRRLDQIQAELNLRERGAKVRLGNALDGGNDPSLANAQLAAVGVGKTELQDAQRLVAAAISRAESQARAQIRATEAPIQAAWTSATKEDRSRYVDANIAAREVGPDRARMQQLRDRASAQQKKEAEAEQEALNKEGSKVGPDRTRLYALRDKVSAQRAKEAEQEQEALNREGARVGPDRSKLYALRDKVSAQQTKEAEQEQAALNKQGAKVGPDRSKLYALRDKVSVQQAKEAEQEQDALNRQGAKVGPDRATLWALRDKVWAQQQKDDAAFERMLRSAQVENQKWEQKQAQQTGATQADANTRQKRYNTTFGDGGASIAFTQTALTANYMVTRGIASAFQGAIKYTVDYEEALAHLHTISGAADGQMQALKETIEGVANATRYGTTDLAKAAAALSETGVTVSQIGLALRGVADLATATGEDFNKTVDTVTGALGSFKLSANDTVDITNMIAQAVNSSRLTMDKLKTSIETAGETASEAGVSFKEMLAANVAITNTGTASGATLGSGLRQLLIDLEKPSEKFKNILSQVGLTEDDINVKTQGLYGAMKNLKDAGFTAADSMQSFDARSSSAFISLSSGLKEMATFEDSLNNTDAAARANSDQMNTLGAQFDRFRNQTSLLVGEGFTPLLYGFKELIRLASDAEAGVRGSAAAVEVLGTIAGGAALAGGAKYVGALVGGLGGMAVGGFQAAAGAAAAGGQIGLIVGAALAATAGVAYLVHSLNDSNRAFDDQKSAVNRAKDALTESQQGMDSVGRTIDTLGHKMVALNQHPELLKREIDDVAKTFEKYGEQLDKSAIHKTEDLIDALKRLHGQMGERYELNTNIVAGQLDLMLEQTKKKLGDSSKEFSLKAFEGPRDKVDYARSRTLEMDPVTGKAVEVVGDINTLPNGKASKGAIPMGQLTLENLPSLIDYLRDIPGAKNVDAVSAGLRQALGANGVPQSAEAVSKALDLLANADGGLTSARTAVTARYNEAGTSAEEKKNINGVDQAIGNLQASLKQIVTETTQTLKSTFSDQKKTSEDKAQIDYEKGAGPTARAAAVDAFLLMAERALTSGSPTNRSLDDLWYAQTMAESGRKQFDKAGNPLRSSKGAVGVAQVTEDTGPEAAADAGEKWDREKWLNDPAYNEKIGKAYMGKLLKQYGGNNTLALAAYNWGQGNVNNTLKDGGDFRSPSNDVTESDFIGKLPKETRDYLARIGGGSGAGAMGQYYRLQNNRELSNSARETAELVAQLEDSRKTANANGDTKEEASVTKLLDKAKERLAEFERKYNSTREAASPALRKVAGADQRALDAQLGVVNKQLNGSTDVDEIQSRANEARDLINSKYQSQIDVLKKTSPKLGNDYSAEVVAQIEKLEEERIAKLKSQDEAVKHHIELVTEAAEKSKLKERMRVEDQAFSKFLNDLKIEERTRSTGAKVDLKANGQTVRDDASQLSYMNDARYSGQFSGVQRQTLAFKQADDQDLLDRANLASANRQKMLLESEMVRASAMRATLDGKQNTLQARSESLTGDSEPVRAEKERVERELNQILAERRSIDSEISAIEGEQTKNGEDRLELEGKINAKKAAPISFSDGVVQANANFMKMHDETATALDGYNNMITTTQGNLVSFFDTILTKSGSAGEAMRAFASSFLKSILSIMEQQAALAIVKQIFGAIGGAIAGGGGESVAQPIATPNISVTPLAIQGGVVSAGGTITRGGSIAHFAGGGSVIGPVRTRDSVYAKVRPGEVIMNNDAVDMVGEDYLNSLNSQGNRMVAKSTPAPAPKREKEPDHVNVWVVAPDQKPQMGPRDIVATISDDIIRGGTSKQLIRRVALGQI